MSDSSLTLLHCYSPPVAPAGAYTQHIDTSSNPSPGSITNGEQAERDANELTQTFRDAVNGVIHEGEDNEDEDEDDFANEPESDEPCVVEMDIDSSDIGIVSSIISRHFVNLALAGTNALASAKRWVCSLFALQSNHFNFSTGRRIHSEYPTEEWEAN